MRVFSFLCKVLVLKCNWVLCFELIAMPTLCVGQISNFLVYIYKSSRHFKLFIFDLLKQLDKALLSFNVICSEACQNFQNSAFNITLFFKDMVYVSKMKHIKKFCIYFYQNITKFYHKYLSFFRHKTKLHTIYFYCI